MPEISFSSHTLWVPHGTEQRNYPGIYYPVGRTKFPMDFPHTKVNCMVSYVARNLQVDAFVVYSMWLGAHLYGS